MIIFQARIGLFGQRGWRKIGFWTWLFALLGDRVVRIIIGSEVSVGEMNDTKYHWFDKRVPVERLHEMAMIDDVLDMKLYKDMRQECGK